MRQNEGKCNDYQKSCEKKLKKIKDALADLGRKEQEINDKLKDLANKDLYLEGYSRRENIKFNSSTFKRGRRREHRSSPQSLS